MKFTTLNPWYDYWYLPTMTGLDVFDRTTGSRVASWYVDVAGRNYKPDHWNFHCLVNTLSARLRIEFASVVKQWEEYVSARLTECRDGCV